MKPGKAERSEWVLRKLRGLVDAVGELEAAVRQERDAAASQGAPEGLRAWLRCGLCLAAYFGGLSGWCAASRPPVSCTLLFTDLPARA